MTELTKTDSNAIIGADQMQMLQSNLEEMAGLISIPAAKVPSGGATMWAIDSGDPENPEMVQDLTGVIVNDYSVHLFFEKSYDEDPKADPLAIWVGKKPLIITDRAKELGVLGTDSVDDEPLNKFDEKLGHTPITMRWTVYLKRLDATEPLPIRVSLPTMSVRTWANFKFQRLLGNPLASVVSLKLRKKENKAGQPYAEVMPIKVDTLDEETYKTMAQYAEAIRPLTEYRAPAVDGAATQAPAEEQAPIQTATDDIPFS